MRSIGYQLRLVGSLLTGRHQSDAHTRYLRAQQRIAITSPRPVLVQGDGELLGRTPVTLGVLRRALRVCVPRTIAGLETTAGAPADTAPAESEAPRETAATAPAGVAGNGHLDAAVPAEPAEKFSQDVAAMVAQHSRTWVLQGWLAHPFSYLAALDAAMFLRVDSLPLGRAGDRLLMLISRVMHYGEGWAIVAFVMLLADFKSGLRVGSEALPVLWATMLTVNFPLKRLFGRHRPFLAFVQARVRGARPLDSSFPSGHTAAAFAGALMFSAHAPWWASVFSAVAIVVGFSRVYLGVHYPSDVVAGGVVGSLLAATYLTILRMALGASRFAF